VFLEYFLELLTKSADGRLPENFQELLDLRELLDVGESGGSAVAIDREDADVRREWLSRLSRHGMQSAIDITGDDRLVFPVPGHKKLIAVRYFVLPKGGVCRGLGADIIKELVRPEHARERMWRLVGLSPYGIHYRTAHLDYPVWLERVAKFMKRDKLERDAYMRSRFCREYAKQAGAVSRVIAGLLFALPESQINDAWTTVRSLVMCERSEGAPQ